jgi:hypothetical protein
MVCNLSDYVDVFTQKPGEDDATLGRASYKTFKAHPLVVYDILDSIAISFSEMSHEERQTLRHEMESFDPLAAHHNKPWGQLLSDWQRTAVEYASLRTEDTAVDDTRLGQFERLTKGTAGTETMPIDTIVVSMLRAE